MKLIKYRQCSFQFSGGDAETVEHKILSNTIYPFTSRGKCTTHKVSAFPLSTGKAPYNLREEQAEALKRKAQTLHTMQTTLHKYTFQLKA